MLFLRTVPLAAAAAGTDVKLTDWLTGYGTVGLALVTVITLIVTVLISRADRRHDDQVRSDDRAEAARRLQDERKAADQRLRDERDHAEALRRRDRQADCAQRLLERIAYLMPELTDIVVGRATIKVNYDPTEALAIGNLWQGLHTDAAVLGDARAAGQYRTLVRLVDAASRLEIGVITPDQARLLGADLRRYAVFVRLSLQRFIECGQALDPGLPPHPQLARRDGDESLWNPESEPDGWRDALESDPDDPWYERPR